MPTVFDMKPNDGEDQWLRRTLRLEPEPPDVDLAPLVRRRLRRSIAARWAQVAAAVLVVVGLAWFVRRQPIAPPPIVAQRQPLASAGEMAIATALFAPPPVDDLSLIVQQQSAYADLLKVLAEE
jgi:hypothetical protein